MANERQRQELNPGLLPLAQYSLPSPVPPPAQMSDTCQGGVWGGEVSRLTFGVAGVNQGVNCSPAPEPESRPPGNRGRLRAPLPPRHASSEADTFLAFGSRAINTMG